MISKLMRLPVSLYQRAMYARRLAKVIPFLDAIKVVSRTTRNRSLLTVTLNANGHLVQIRANTSDVKCLEQVFINEDYQIPSHANPSFDIDPKFIVDAGANIGMASLYFANRFPNAKILAIEPELSNFELLNINTKSIVNIETKQGAIWNKEADLKIADPNVDKWLYTVKPLSPDDVQSSIKAITIAQLLKESDVGIIDILKLDIEGAEKELFSDNCVNWLPRVKMIIIELHDRLNIGCSKQFYSQLSKFNWIQEVHGENIFILLMPNESGTAITVLD